MPNFDEPLWLLALLLIPALIFIHFRKSEKGPRQVYVTGAFAHWKAAAEELGRSSPGKRSALPLHLVLTIVFVALTSVYAATPRFDDGKIKVDVIFIDNSASLLASDDSGARYKLLKDDALEFIGSSGSRRMFIVGANGKSEKDAPEFRGPVDKTAAAEIVSKLGVSGGSFDAAARMNFDAFGAGDGIPEAFEIDRKFLLTDGCSISNLSEQDLNFLASSFAIVVYGTDVENAGFENAFFDGEHLRAKLRVEGAANEIQLIAIGGSERVVRRFAIAVNDGVATIDSNFDFAGVLELRLAQRDGFPQDDSAAVRSKTKPGISFRTDGSFQNPYLDFVLESLRQTSAGGGEIEISVSRAPETKEELSAMLGGGPSILVGPIPSDAEIPGASVRTIERFAQLRATDLGATILGTIGANEIFVRGPSQAIFGEGVTSIAGTAEGSMISIVRGTSHPNLLIGFDIDKEHSNLVYLVDVFPVLISEFVSMLAKDIENAGSVETGVTIFENGYRRVNPGPGIRALFERSLPTSANEGIQTGKMILLALFAVALAQLVAWLLVRN
ncbi:MAG: hypothetical protein NUW37_15355 [Planctomycetes bacterium]|nr:hypothetical protein [Planctomycetota bacterium]